MIINTKSLETERLLLKRGTKEDYRKVYEYDFRKLRNINNEFEFVKQDLSKVDNWVLESDNNEDFADWIIYLKDMTPIGNITHYTIANSDIDSNVNVSITYKKITKSNINETTDSSKPAVTEENPNTFDNITLMVTLFGISILGIVASALGFKKKNN